MASSYHMRASTSSASASKWKYDVFLSFRGSDTRRNFTDHLYDKLQCRGITTFRDDTELERGTTLSSELLAAIEQSRFAVVVLSPNYASSTWCLLELVKIVACMGDGGSILPIFYEVDPSDVRHQRGSFAEAFAEHEDKLSGEDLKKVQEWGDALTTVANLSGWDSKDYRYETELIKEIVEALWKKVHPTFASSESSENLVGIDSKLIEIDFLLEKKAKGVCFLGIWGMCGIGKTTLARLVYHRISHHFEISIFLPDVREVSTTHGLVNLQQNLLCQILKEKNIQVWDVDDGMTKIKCCFYNKKVLLVLDDVDQLDQLENLAGEEDWFGSGSIVIVTTRDQRLLVLHGIETQYKSKGLNEYEALQLFSWKAFKKDYPEEGYRELSKSILDYARGLPLALKILGSFLCKRDRGDWESTVAKLKKAPIDQALFKTLKISYDGLDNMSQQVFLDVACFLKGNDKERVIRILDSFFGFDTSIMASVLIEKSLLTIFDNCVDMHDLIQEMGREIVRLESEQEPGQRSQLWLWDDIFHVLKENTGTEAIRSIAICLPKVEEFDWNPKAFSKMSKLKFLKMQNLVLCQGPEYLPDAIRVLEWAWYPSKSLPPNFQPVELIEIILHHSKIEQLWHGIKYLEKLTVMDLSYSENLTMTPDFTGMPNLERLVLEGCTNLVDIHPSIISLRRLKVLNFKNCQSIQRIPGGLEMDSLELIDLSGCSKVDILPQFVRRIQKLSELFLRGIGMLKFELSFHSVSPHRLSLVLASFKHFCSLKELHLNDCKLGEGDIPDDIGCLSSLENLDLSVNNFVSLPASLSRLSKLKYLNLDDCKRLQQLPDLPLFSGTCHVTADNCISLKKFPDPPDLCKLWKLSFNFINCCSLEDGGSCYIIRSLLQRFLQEPPPFFEMFSIVIPGNDIPCWFKHRIVGDTVLDCSSPSSMWIGFALCVLFGAEENPGVPGEDHDFEPHAKAISCCWKPGVFFLPSLSFDLNQVLKSDHICLFLLPSKHYLENIGFLLETTCAKKSNACLKVKGCGVRALYKQDLKELVELNLRMNRYNGVSDRNLGCMMNKPPLFTEEFSFVFSGNDIPEWFETSAESNRVNIDRPCISCSSTWMGFALCVLFGAEENPGALCEDRDLEPHVHKISCRWMLSYGSIVLKLEQVVQLSDHLCVFFVPGDKCLLTWRWFTFKFRTRCANRNACLKVKGCGIRSLYMQDLKEPNIRENQYNVSKRDGVADWIEQLRSSIN
ncbi:TMV resistance protein N-like [Rosa rugosa]|uniref:TMV resistance protein N-like n=1 Tax=Rosa rugosa TaxID=74645 RepID=UPI002B41207A|nr:TMV resistance protein N-like [Rosa rugosa]